MKNIPYGFQSLLLVQKKLLEIFSSPKRNNKTCIKIVVNPCNNTMTKISTVPLFHRDLWTIRQKDHDISTDELRALWFRGYKRAYEKLNSERGRETIAKVTS